MNEILSRIIEAEKRAQEIVADAKHSRANLEIEIKQKLDEIEDTEKRSLSQKLEMFRSEQDGRLAAQLNRIKAEKAEKVNVLKEKYEKNKSAWISSIANRIIGTRG